MNPPPQIQFTDSRRGSVLILVLVVVVLLTFSVYSFSEFMLREYEISQRRGQQYQTDYLSESGLEALLAHVEAAPEKPLENPQSFRRVEVFSDREVTGCFSIYPQFSDSAGNELPFLLHDESAKLNLNALPLDLEHRSISRFRLMALPGMTRQIADAILDWMDSDDQPLPLGAETAYYSSLATPYAPRQGRLERLEELLLVRGVTPPLLFGEDGNHNGILDLNENDGPLTQPPDNADGVLDRGWSAWLTVFSRESTLKADGSPKINVNAENLASLYDQLEEQLGEQPARFIVALRLAGPVDPIERIDLLTLAEREELARLKRAASAAERLKEQLGQGDPLPGPDYGQRGGLSLDVKPMFQVHSLLDLVDTRVRIEVNGQDAVLISPWPGDPASVGAAVEQLDRVLTVTGAAFLPGRINVNQAPAEVLQTVPGLSESLAESILARQRNRHRGHSSRSAVWLLEQGLVDLNQLRLLAPYVTGRGDVFRGVSIGHLSDSPTASATLFLLDASVRPPRFVETQELSPVRFPLDQPSDNSR